MPETKIVELTAKNAELQAELAGKDKAIEELTAKNEELSAKATSLEEKTVELGTKVGELETSIKKAELEAQNEQIKSLIESIVELDKDFNAKIYLHEDLSFDASKQLLEALYEDKKKASKSVNLSGLPPLDNSGIDVDKIDPETQFSLRALLTGQPD